MWDFSKQIGQISQASPQTSTVVNQATRPLGNVFERLGGKNAPRQPEFSSVLPAGQAPYTTLPNEGRAALLQAMLTRARSGQPGGAPVTPAPGA